MWPGLGGGSWIFFELGLNMGLWLMELYWVWALWFMDFFWIYIYIAQSKSNWFLSNLQLVPLWFAGQ